MLNILILVAHADDEVLGPGGFITKLAKKNVKIKLAVVSDGKITVRNKLVDNTGHLFSAAKQLGINDIKILDFKDQKFDTYPIADIANAVSRLNFDPDIIITHSKTELNKDHRITFEVAKIISRPKNNRCSILCFEIPNNSFWNQKTFKPNFFVDITKEIKNKILSLKKYKNEIKKYPHPCSSESLELIAKYQGFLCGYKYAEAYEIIRLYDEHLFYLKK